VIAHVPLEHADTVRVRESLGFGVVTGIVGDDSASLLHKGETDRLTDTAGPPGDDRYACHFSSSRFFASLGEGAGHATKTPPRMSGAGRRDAL